LGSYCAEKLSGERLRRWCKTPRFNVGRLAGDCERREMASIRTSQINGTSKKVSENFIFNKAGFDIATAVSHGIG
jgi:hypothetical protein